MSLPPTGRDNSWHPIYGSGKPSHQYQWNTEKNITALFDEAYHSPGNPQGRKYRGTTEREARRYPSTGLDPRKKGVVKDAIPKEKWETTQHHQYLTDSRDAIIKPMIGPNGRPVTGPDGRPAAMATMGATDYAVRAAMDEGRNGDGSSPALTRFIAPPNTLEVDGTTRFRGVDHRSWRTKKGTHIDPDYQLTAANRAIPAPITMASIEIGRIVNDPQNRSREKFKVTKFFGDQECADRLAQRITPPRENPPGFYIP